MMDPLTPLRDDHKQQTRTRILDAAAELICERGEDAVTMLTVAKRAGVSERTVYRHYKNRGTIIQAVWQGLRQRIGPTPIPRNANELIDEPLTSFPRYDNEQALLRAYLDSRRKRLDRGLANRTRQAGIISCFEDQVSKLNEDEIVRRAAIVELLTSEDAWDRMCSIWGFDGTEAGQAAMEALEALLGLCPADG